MTEGDTATASATVYMSDGSTRTSGISWSSSNTGVVSVSSGGTLSARSAGSSTITATYDNHQASFTVSVSAKPQQQSTPTGSGDYSYLLDIVKGCPSGTTPHGRTYYAFYPIVDEINKERRALGLSDVQYADENWARERATAVGQVMKNRLVDLDSIWYEDIESGQSNCWNPDYTPKESFISISSPTRYCGLLPELNYHIEVGGHSGKGGSQIVGFVYNPSPERVVAAIKASKSHWRFVTNPNANAVDCRIYIDTSTGFGYFAMSMDSDQLFLTL